jgi:hypothetical protein
MRAASAFEHGVIARLGAATDRAREPRIASHGSEDRRVLSHHDLSQNEERGDDTRTGVEQAVPDLRQ